MFTVRTHIVLRDAVNAVPTRPSIPSWLFDIRSTDMLPGHRSLLLGACALLLVSGCGSSSTGSSSGRISPPGRGTAGTGGSPTGNPIGGGGGPTGSNNSVVATPSAASVSVVVGA